MAQTIEYSGWSVLSYIIVLLFSAVGGEITYML